MEKAGEQLCRAVTDALPGREASACCSLLQGNQNSLSHGASVCGEIFWLQGVALSHARGTVTARSCPYYLGGRSCCSGHAVMAVMLPWSSLAAARVLTEDFTIQTSVFCRLPRALPGMLAYERPPPFVLRGWQCDLPGQAASPLCTFLWPAICLGLLCRVLVYFSCACNFSVASLLCSVYASINNDGGLAIVPPLPFPPRLIQKYSLEIS